jgi:amino acid transporter
MLSANKRIVAAVIIGLVATIGLYIAGSVAYAKGHPNLSRILYWQGPFLQSFEHPPEFIGGAREGTPVTCALFFAGIPFGIVLYTSLAFMALGTGRRKNSRRA